MSSVCACTGCAAVDLRQRVQLLEAQLDAERRHAAQWRQVAEERQAALDRLRGQPGVRTLVALAPIVLPPARRTVHRVTAGLNRAQEAVLRLDPFGRARLARVRRATSALAPPGAVGRRVSVVLVHPAPPVLASLREHLRQVDTDVELVVVAGPAVLQVPDDVVLVADSSDLGLPAARNLGAAAASGDVLCFLSPGLTPLSPHWLAWLAAALDDDVLVSAPRLASVAGQHAGIALVPDATGPPTLTRLSWSGAPEQGSPASEVVAAGDACLAVTAAGFRAVGGFDERYTHAATFALCWAVRERLGGRTVVVHQSVLRHADRSGRALDREARLVEREVVERLGPALRRSLELDRIAGAGSARHRAYSLAIGLDADVGLRWSQTGARLADALRDVGWDVSPLRQARSDALASDVDAVLVAGPALDLAGLPPEVTSVAWVDKPLPPAAPSWVEDADVVVATGAAVVDGLAGVRTRRPPVVATALDRRSTRPSADAQVDAVREALRAVVASPRIAFVTGIPDRRLAAHWGDWPFAQSMAREVRALGYQVSVHTSAADDVRAARAADALVHLRGRGRLPRSAGQVHVIWSISHPAELTVEECDQADLVLVASHTGFDVELRGRTSTPVSVLLQATDDRRFRPHPPVATYRDDVVFVGNSRHVERPVVRDAVAAGLRPVLYGRGWERFVDPSLVRRTYVDNAELPAVYSSAGVLLNDHWDDMRRYGYASNRLFDALATGAVVVSDELAGLDDLFHGAVATYRSAEDLGRTVRLLLESPEEAARRGAEGRRAVLAAHTFRHRAAQLVADLSPLLGTRSSSPASA